MKNSFRRYTNIAAALHLLRRKCITLLDPENWDDKNDAFFMAEYKRLTEARTLLALCFAECKETYHHWRIFSHGSDGVCLQFDKAALTKCLCVDQRIKHGRVNYKPLATISRMNDVDVKRLPFYKRWPYGDEAEYRFIFVDHEHESRFYDLPIELATLKEINLSPWLQPALVDTVRETIKSIPGCEEIKVFQSTLIDNEIWKQLSSRALVLPTDG